MILEGYKSRELIGWALEQMALPEHGPFVLTDLARVAGLGASDEVCRGLVARLSKAGMYVWAHELAKRVGGLTLENLQAIAKAYTDGVIAEHHETEQKIGLMFQEALGTGKGTEAFHAAMKRR